MILVVNIHILNIGKKLKEKEMLKRKFEDLFTTELKVSEPTVDSFSEHIITRDNGLKIIIRKRSK